MSLMKYSAINAKLKALGKAMIKNDDYKEFSGMKSVEEFGKLLKDSPAYKYVLSELSEAELRREPLERNLIYLMFDEFARVLRFVTNLYEKKYLIAYFRKNEIAIIKKLLRSVIDERDISYELPTITEAAKGFITINIEKLAGSKTIEEFIENLAGSEYHTLLSKILNDNLSLFTIEIQLDLDYFVKLNYAQNRLLNNKDKAVQKRLNGLEVDMRNISCIYRAKKYYKFESTIIYSLLIPLKYKISNSELKLIIEAPTVEAFKDELQKTYYGKIFQSFETGKLELNYYKTIQRVNKIAGKTDPYSVNAITAYMAKMENEIKNITTLIEGIRYSVNADKILDMLILPEKSVGGDYS